MYAQLQYNPGQPNAAWTVHYFLCKDLVPPALTPAQAAERGRALGQVFNEVGQIDESVRKDLMAIGRVLPVDTEDLVSDLYMALAHLRLPEAQRESRRARIDQTLDAHFQGTPPLQAVQTGIAHIKMTAQLVPDALLEAMVRSQAARLQLTQLADAGWHKHFMPFMDHLDVLAASLGCPPGTPEKYLLINTGFSRPLAERDEFLGLLKQAIAHKLGASVQSSARALRDGGLLLAFEGDTFVDVLRECVAMSDARVTVDIQQVAANQVTLGRAADDRRTQAVFSATVEALDAGVPFGDKVKKQNEAALDAARQVWAAQQLRMTPERLRLRRKLAQSATTGKSMAPPNNASPPDLDPVSAWSVKRLLRWIRGPISDAAPQRLDRQAILAEEKAARQQARISARAPEKSAKVDAELTEEDVGAAMHDALGTCAEFCAAEVRDLLYRLQALNIASPAAQASEKLLAPLSALAEHPDGDEQKARVLLHQAEEACQRLRQEIHAGEIDARTRQQFAQSLQLALSQAVLVEGKRHGGVIACPLKRSDWPWVADQYHGRWLPWLRQINIDGQNVPLPDDLALALYVTGKSLSGYEFDISVHLWQRRPGCTGKPGVSSEPFARMNTQEWDDTLTPCTVLHVPQVH
jgi:hypothetical protein